MNDITLPDDKRRSIEARTRAEFGITAAEDKRGHRIAKATRALGWAAAGASAALVGYRWGGLAAFTFIFTFFAPAAVGGIVCRIADTVLTRLLLPPKWSSYQTTKEQRTKEAAEAYKQEVVQTAAFWQSLDGHTFEREFARLLREHGYHAEVTPGSGDGGVDIIARNGGRRVAIQCKRYGKPVGPAVVRELYGALTAGNYDRGILAVTGGVTKGVRDFVVGKAIDIVDLPQIIRLQMEANEKRRSAAK